MQQLHILGIPPTLNEMNNMGYRERAQHKKVWQNVTILECKSQKIKKVHKPVIITYRFHFKKNGRRDPDNYSYSAKSIQDGLVHAGILEDDNFNFVHELRIARGENRKEKGITIEIVEVEE